MKEMGKELAKVNKEIKVRKGQSKAREKYPSLNFDES
jgi:hypothetical protein